MQARRIPIFLVVLIIAIAIANGLADKYYWYWTMRWFDIPMHFAGGMWLAGVAVWWYRPSQSISPVSFSKILAICLCAALGVGLLWELYEAGVSFLTVGHINAMSDTLKDLLFDTIGGTTVAVFTWWRIRRNNKQS